VQGLAGNWTGVLSYKDYGTGKTTRIEARAVGVVDGAKATLAWSFPREPGHEGTTDFTVSADGASLGGLALVERTEPSPGVVRLVTEERGNDGNDAKPATFRHELVVGPKELRVAKLVRFDGTAEFFERSAYTVTRDTATR
jgi:hypothetical protein